MIIENPTVDQQRKIKNIVYLITNLVNGKHYVGLTVQTFRQRYSCKKWWDKLDCKDLKNDIEKYGIENFQVRFLETEIEDIIELNSLEHLYATIYDCYFPYGYNVARCGRSENYRESILRGFRKSQVVNRKIKLKDRYEFIDPNNNLIIITDLLDFCKKNNLKNYEMTRVDAGVRKHHRGYYKPENAPKVYKFISPEDVIYEVRGDCLAKFSRQHGFKTNDLTYLTRKQCKIYNGWRLLENRHLKPIEKIVKLQSPDCTLFIVDNVFNFCRANNLDYSTIRKVIRGEKTHYKGWKMAS
jgi:group I intron endonuclease